MSVQRTRLQYVFVNVQRSDRASSVVLIGPTEVLNGISTGSSPTDNVRAYPMSVGNATQITLRPLRGHTNDYLLWKMALLEEILKLGFKPTSNISDDFLTLCREVNM